MGSPGRAFAAPLALAIALAACSGGGGGEASREEVFRVALLTPGSVADGGWNQGAYEGLLRMRDELGAEISHVETRSPAESEEAFRDYARQGFDLVFGHGFEYQEPAARVAAEYPETVFITTSGKLVRPNLAPIVFQLGQVTYLCGLLGARMSATGRLGLVGGVDLPSIKGTFIAFRAGAASARPDVEVREVYTGNFNDVAAAREAALALLEEGVDILMHQANDAGRGVFRAVQDHAARGRRVFAFGTNRNQNDMAPDVVLGSAVIDLPRSLLEVARRVREGRFQARPLRLGLREGAVRLELNPRLRHVIPPSVLDELARREQDIREGRLEVPGLEL